MKVSMSLPGKMWIPDVQGHAVPSRSAVGIGRSRRSVSMSCRRLTARHGRSGTAATRPATGMRSWATASDDPWRGAHGRSRSRPWRGGQQAPAGGAREQRRRQQRRREAGPGGADSGSGHLERRARLPVSGHRCPPARVVCRATPRRRLSGPVGGRRAHRRVARPSPCAVDGLAGRCAAFASGVVNSGRTASPAHARPLIAHAAHGRAGAVRRLSRRRPRAEHPGSDPAGTYRLSHLRTLEAEAMHMMREVAAEFERPVLLFCGGKDSIVLLRLAEKAFRPGLSVPGDARGHRPQLPRGDRVPRPAHRGDRRAADRRLGRGLDRAGRVVDETGPRASRNALQTVTLLDAIAEHGFDAAFGGARRDEERARAKERILSFRDEFGQWEPQRQRPELWGLYNGRMRRGEHVRVFPISNWTELDVWQYIAEEQLEVPSIYFAHEREVFARDGMLYAVSPHVQLAADEQPFTASSALPHGGRHDVYGRGRVRRGDAAGGRARDRRDRASPSAGRRAPTIGSGGGDGGSQAPGVLLMAIFDPTHPQTAAQQLGSEPPSRRTTDSSRGSPSARRSCCASPRPARSTTARAR